MKKQNEMTEPKQPAQAAQYRYRLTPPTSVTVKAADLEAAIPRAQRLKPFTQGQTVDLPAAAIFSGNVPKISLDVLARLLPGHVAPSEAFIVLPAGRLATAYALVEQGECVKEAPPQEAVTSSASVPDGQAPVEPSMPPQKRHGLFSGLPIFRRKPPQESEGSDPLPTAEGASDALSETSNAAEPSEADSAPKASAAEGSISACAAKPVAQGRPDRAEIGLQEKPGGRSAEAPVDPAPIAAAEKPKKAPAPDLHAKPLPPRLPELADQEPLQSLFLTEDALTVDRVVALCCGLPGINSCVLTCGSFVVASHNAPDNMDLVSMSSHAVEMLHAMRTSSARMGVGSVPAVTLHSEKGVISFFHREGLTLLVFHIDRGFVPGVREKLAIVLGELAKAGISLPSAG